MDAMRPTARRAARRRSTSGFSLIEVMVSLGLLAFGLLGVAAMQLAVLEGGTKGRRLSEATSTGRNQLELMQRIPWADAALTDTSNLWTANVPVAGTDGSTFQVASRIDDISADLKAIDVRVSWTEPGRNRSLILSSGRLQEP